MKKRYILLLLILSLIFPLTRFAYHLGIMSLNNLYHRKESLEVKKNIQVDFPVGNEIENQEWFPMMLTYNPGKYFSDYVGQNVHLTILYNFGGYDLARGSSSFYDPTSPYHGAFYGAYIVEAEGEPFSYIFDASGHIIDKSLHQIAKYDYTNLVLRGLGAESNKIEFEEQVTSIRNTDLVGYHNWTEINAEIHTNGPLHKAQKFRGNYLQFGFPPYDAPENFPPTKLYSRVWVRKFEEKNVTIVLYAMTPDPSFLNDMSDTLIRETVISLN